MIPEQWQQVKALFHSALELTPERRAAYLNKACMGQDSLRKEVESLIAAHEKTGSFIDSPAYERVTTPLLEEDLDLKVGQTVGSYEILAPLGRGGMGEVYLSLDRRLRRKVALKFLPASFTKDAEHLQRFEREARAASALNHPNIITIHEIGETDSLHFIATEFVEGETLRARLLDTKLSLTETLRVTLQIADALTAAHRAGIIHRDIKPENIMLRPDGYVKVLDFGLAKLISQQASQIHSDAPTRTQFNTSPGAVMGTARYMSPEQLRGLPVDERTDIWSLGCVLQEMVTGQTPFAGPTASDSIARILEHEPPPLADQAPDAPAELQRIIRKALRKDRDERYQTTEELLVDLRSLKHQSGQAAHPTSSVDSLGGAVSNRRRSLLIAVGIIFAAVLAIAIYKFLSTKNSAVTQPERAEMAGVLKTTQITTWGGFDLSPTFSPDGSSIAYSSDHTGNFEIYVKPLVPGGREIQLTSDGEQNLYPAWSPDGKLIAYHSRNGGGIRVIPALGGTTRQLTEFGSRPAWSRDASQIAFQSDGRIELGATTGVAQTPSTIWVVPAQGGAAKQITQAGNPAGGHGAPSWSPDGSRIIFCTGETNAVWAVSANGDQLKQLSPSLGSVFGAIYAPDGESIYYGAISQDVNFGLWKQSVSPSGEAVGEPLMIANTGGLSNKYLAISADGKRLAFSAVLTTSNLWSLPLSQNTNSAAGPPSPLTSGTNLRNVNPAFSPDGRKIAFGTWRTGADSNVWVMDADGKNQTQVTTDPASDNFPSWLPDGDQISFISNRHGRPGVWVTSLKSGRDRLLLDPGQDLSFARLSPDGKQFVFNSSKSGTINLWLVSLEDGKPRQLTFDQELMGFPLWSPDGKFIAFMIKRGDDAHVAMMPKEGGAPTQLTFDQGLSFVAGWSPDGDKIAYAGQRNGIWNLYWVSRTTKEQKQLTNNTKLNVYVRYPSWSPLGNQIAYEYAETTGNIWIMDLK